LTAGRDDGQPGVSTLLRVIRPAQIDRCGHGRNRNRNFNPPTYGVPIPLRDR
jgi:hypothetical protein